MGCASSRLLVGPVYKLHFVVYTGKPAARPPKLKKTLIVAIAKGYKPVYTHRFMGSLRKANCNSHVVLIVRSTELQGESANIMRAQPYNAEVLSDTYAQGLALKFFEEEKAQNPHIKIPETSSNSLVLKWYVGTAFCRLGKYEYCLILDFRDVFFQLDPFLRWPSKGTKKNLVFFEEEHAYTIKSQPHNSRWMRECINRNARIMGIGNQTEEFERIGKEWIINSGTIGGTPQGLTHLSLEAAKARECADQGFLNLLVYRALSNPRDTGSISMVIERSGEGGMVHTLGFPGKNDNDTLGRTLEHDGVTVSAILHQYDRKAKIKQRIAEIYGADS